MAHAHIPVGIRVTGRQKQLLVATIALAIFVTSLEAQIAAVAAPRLVADLGGFSLFSWVFTSFMVASTVAIPICGKLSDTYGRRPFVLVGLALFVAASASCALAVSMPMLIGSRALQGLGAGAVTSSLQATVADLFPPAERGKYSAIFFAGVSLAQLSGPSLGGFITDSVGWRWCFLASAPPAAVAFSFIYAYLPGRQGPRRPLRLDLLGAILLALATITLLLGLAWSDEQFGWVSTPTIGLLGSSVVLWTLFILQARRHPNPILSLHLLRERNFTVALCVVCLVTGGTQAVVAYLPTFVQVSLHSTATASGLITTPQALGALVGAFAGGQLISRMTRWRTQVLSFLVVMVSACIFVSTLGVGSPEWRVSAAMGAIGFSSAGLQATNSVIILNSVPAHSIGIASGLRAFSMQVTIVFSIAVMGVVLSTSYGSSFDSHLQPETRSQLPASVLSGFDDPTFSLNQQHLDDARAALAAAGRPPDALDQAVKAEQEAVADSIHNVFYGILAMLAIATVMATLYRATSLRRTFEVPAEVTLAESPG